MKKIIHCITAIAFFFLSIVPSPGFAFNVNVVQGNATVSTNGNTVTITATGRAILQGNTSIPSGVTVDVIQGVNDIMLRDITGSRTDILGSLLSNGNIILINAMGIFIGQSANVNVGGLIASTLDMKNNLFMSGNYQFEKIPGLNPAEILNEANINIANGGYIILLADRVVNKGTITAYMGTVALGSGQQATVSFDQGGLVNLVIDQGLAQQLTNSSGKSKAQIVNSGKIYANGGRIQMTAELLETTLEQIVNNTGVLQANNVAEQGGIVELTASGAINNSGTIQAASMIEQAETFHSTGVLDVGHGYFNNLDGAINISGSISGTIADVGDIDLTGAVSLTGDTTLQADSGGAQSGEIVMNTNPLTGNNFNLTMYTGENDTLDGSITGVNLLTLNSSTVNDKIFTSTGASFSVNTLQTNNYALFSRSQGSGTALDPYMIYSVSNAVGGLQYIPTESLSAVYKLANNINAAETSSWNSEAGFTPLGNSTTPFTGTFNGNNYTISNLFINLPTTDNVGLFGYTSGATIENVGLVNANITGQYSVGALVGYATNSSSINNSYATGGVSGNLLVGALVGTNYRSSIDNSYATGSVSGSDFVGGLVGYNVSSSSISNSYATGSVSDSGGVGGGFVGLNNNSSIIINSYATGSVNGSNGNWVGGFAGDNVNSSSIINSYATGNVNGGDEVGSFVGGNHYSSSIANSYATGNVSGSNNVGGLVGENNNSGSIANSYATGSVSGSSNVGGLIGYDSGGNTLTNNWWYNSLSNGIGGGTGDTSNISVGHWQKAGSASDFFNPAQAVYNGTSPWDISSTTGHIWAMSGDNDAFPLLQFRYATTISDDIQLQLMFLNLGASYSLANNIDATATSNWNMGAGFDPVGSSSSPFTGTFNGNNYTISNLFINLPTTDNVGLFGYTSGATIENVGLVNANITGQNNVGALVGYNNSSSADNSYATGSVTGNGWGVGGLVGYSYSSNIDNSYAGGSVSGSGSVGGLVGSMGGGTVSNSFYDINSVFINGGHVLTIGGIYDSQYQDWMNHGKALTIGNYLTLSGGYYQITDVTDLKNFLGFSESNDNTNKFILTNDLDLNGSPGLYVPYLGVEEFNGNFKTISNLSINLPNNADIGFFGYAVGSNIHDLGIVSGSVTGYGNVGALVGFNNNTIVNNAYATAPVTGNQIVGGLIGYNNSSSISNSYATGNVSGSSAGGLVGRNDNSSSISNSYATGSISGTNFVGSLVGDNFSSSIDNSYATGSVSGEDYVGGLVGGNYSSSIANSYATGSVSGEDYVGGLVGSNYSSSIANSYATGSVRGTWAVGGLVGINEISSSIANSYATGSVTGSTNVGGLIGYDDVSNTLTNNWWYNSLSQGIGNNASNISVGQWQEAGSASDFFNPSQAVYTGTGPWDFTNTWLAPGDTYPLLSYSVDIWTGSGNWSNPTNWSKDAVPTANVLFNATSLNDSTIDAFGGNIGSLVITSGYTGIIAQNSDLTISGSYIQSGGTFVSDTTKAFTVGNDFSLSGGTFSRFTGLGTGLNPYLIYDVYGLQGMGEYLSSTFGLHNNIDASGTSNWNSGAGFTPIGISSPFTGTFNGNNYTISNLFINLPTTDNVGLFGYTSGATIENVGLLNANITGQNNVGALVGYSNNSSRIDNSYATGSVSGNQNIGGLVGYNTNTSSIDNSYATGSVSGVLDIGGLVGQNYSSSIDNSYATGSVIGSGNAVGGLVGANDNLSSIINSYATGNVIGYQGVGGLVGYNVFSSSIDNDYATGNVSGNSDVGGLIGYDSGGNTLTNNWWYNSLSNGIGSNGPNTNVGHWQKAGSASDFFSTATVGSSTGNAVYWDSGVVGGTLAWDVSPSLGHVWALSGDDDAFPLLQFRYATSIQDEYQLQLMFLNLGATYTVANNIDATATSNWNAGGGFAPIGISSPFTGTFNGNNYTISNLFINLPTTDNVGLLGQTSGATIENVGLVNANITGQNNVGSLVGYNNSSRIDNSYATGSVSGGAHVGGLVGFNYDSSSIDNSYATGSVNGNNLYVGGLVGFNDNSSSINNSYATGSVSGSNTRVGGLVGGNYASSRIDNSYAIGSVSGGSGNFVGGLVGINLSSSIANSYATGSVSGSSYVGGLVGIYYGSSSLVNSYATGSVSGSNAVGGLVGVNYGSSIANSYATGLVLGGTEVGGFVGEDNGGIYTANFFDHTVNSSLTGTGNNGDVSGISGEITANMKTESTFTGSGWDFNGLWKDGAGVAYPTLIWQGMNNGPFIGGTAAIPFLVNNVNQLQFMGYAPSNSFQLASDIDASATSGWNAGAGFTPVGNSTTPFTGTFNGNNYTIANLLINLPTTNDIGLFGYTSGATIENVGLVNANITGASWFVGSLVGYNNSGSITNSYATGSVSGGSAVGGLVGGNYFSSKIDNSYATGSVSAANGVGGLVGYNGDSSSIDNSYATGSVRGGNWVGGLVGNHFFYSSITNSYATGNVSASGGCVGGLVGGVWISSITNSYATGSVSGSNSVGGLVGNYDYGSIVNSYYTDSSHQNGVGTYDPAGPSDFYNISNPVYSGWDFTNTWVAPGNTYPLLSFSVDIWTGSGNWSTAANWSKNAVPTNNVLFNATSLNDSTIDVFGGDIGSLVITSGYTGSITQNSALTLSGNYLQTGGTFNQNANLAIGGNFSQSGGAFVSDPTKTFTVGNSFSLNGGTFSRFTGLGTGLDPYLIYDIYGLQGMEEFLSNTFGLANNIDASGTSNWNAGAGFAPVGNSSTPFTGTFNGNSYTISNLFINLPSTNNVGLLGYTSGAIIENVGLVNDNIKGANYVGGLVGWNNSSNIDNSYAIGSVSGSAGVGGLVGYNNSSSIDNSYATGSVSGSDGLVGGLVGYNNSSSIANSYATGSVNSSSNYVGGLVGSNLNSSSITNSYATGSISASSDVGGLIGINALSSNIANSYATGSVSGSSSVGGLVGGNYRSSSIDNSYATGNVSGSGSSVGGLVGTNGLGNNVTNSYATGSVTGNSNVGGFIGNDDGTNTLTNNWWYNSLSQGIGNNASNISVGHWQEAGSASDFFNPSQAVYTGTGPWDFTNTWVAPGDTYPLLAFSVDIWTGSGNWSNPANWSKDAVPTDNVLFNATSINDSTIDAFGGDIGSLVITSGYTGSITQNSALTLSGSYFQDGGTFNQNNNLSIAGSYANTDGIFNAGSQPVTFTGSGTITSGSTLFNNLNVSATGTYTLTDGITTTGNFTQTSGIFIADPTQTTFSIGGSFSLQGGEFNRFTGSGTGVDPYLIYDVYGLQGMGGFLSSTFGLHNDIDASTTSSWNLGAGFTPIGNNSTPFTGTFNGNNYTISNLFVNLPSTNDVGLFGKIVGAAVENIGLVSANITGQNNVGSLVGYSNSSSSITNSYATGSVSGASNIGGLVGGNYNSSSIDNSYTTGNVSGNAGVGGLVGFNSSSSITNSYATDSVNSNNAAGGLTGYNANSSSIDNSYATGNVSGSFNVGGLAGGNYNSSSIVNSYATGSVSGSSRVGGLVGYNNNSSSITNSFATGSASGSSNIGGLVGSNSSSIINNSYYTDSNNQNGLGTFDPNGASDFYSPANPVYAIGTPGGWDIFTPIWDTYTNELPHLHWEHHSGSLTPYWLGTSSSDFDTASNWSNDSVPGINSTVIIFSGTNEPTLSEITTLANFLIGSGTFTQNTALTLTGNYAQGGGTYDQNANLTISGNFSQSGGAFVSDPTKAFTVGNSFYLSGGTFSRFTGLGTGTDPYLIYDVYGLQGMGGFLSNTFGLVNDIDASGTSNWNSGAGFTPVGNSTTPFTGTFNGNNYTISNLFINLPTTNGVGLFGYTSGASIRSVGLVNVNITGALIVGALVGYNSFLSTIDNSYATGSVSGVNSVGGLVGLNVNSSSIDNSYATDSVSGNYGVGGLASANDSSSTIANSYATGSVSGSGDYVGGLVGYNNNSSSITNSYASGSVSGSGGYVGGLVGKNNDSSSIANSYATGNINGSGNVGGLVGWNYLSSITNSYATGSVSGGALVGGLVGYNTGGSSIDNSYATGSVSGSSNVGGLIGDDDGSNTLTNNWWYNSLSQGIGNNASNTSVGQWQEAGSASDFFNPAQAVYNGTNPWDISSTTGHIWAMSGDNDAFPLLQFRYAATITDAYQLQLMFLNLGATYSLANNIDATETLNWNAGGGFAPIGSNISPFTGTFNGNNYTISNLFINLPSMNDVGLFGQTSGATIENVGLVNANITGQNNVGGLVGDNSSHSSIANTYATGNVNGSSYVGGLVGFNVSSSSIDNSYTTGSVNGSDNYIGGLVGFNYNASSIDNSYASGSVSGSGWGVGGLVGGNTSSSIANSYATGNVSGSGWGVGGLVGVNANSGHIDNSYATGSVNGSGNDVGGLVGYNIFLSSIDNSYASGSVNGSGNNVGGLVGYNIFLSSIDNSYASGNVSGTTYVGGLVGNNYKSSIITNSFATGSASASSNVGGLVGYNHDSSSIDNSYYTDSSHQNGLGTFDSNGASDFYSPLNPVYAIGTPGGWDFFTPIWDTYTDQLPHLHWENHSGNSNPLWLGTSSSDFDTASNWADDSVPGSSSTAIIESGTNEPTLSVITTLANFIIGSGTFTQNSALTLTGTYLQIGGTYDQNANLSIGGNFSQSGGAFVSDPTKTFTVGNSFSLNGGTFSRFTGLGTGLDPYLIYDVYGLQAMEEYLSSPFGLHNDIDASGTSNWNSGAGFAPIGNNATPFSGTLNGNSYTISNLFINLPTTNGVGLFGSTSGATIENVGLVNADVMGQNAVGGLVGYNLSSSIDNSYVTGSVSGSGSVGGLVGNSNSSSITNSYVTGIIGGSYNVGGLVGWSTSSSIDNSYATGSVSGGNEVGGLVGSFYSGTIANSFYDIDTVSINGGHVLTMGGIYDSQYQDWMSHGQSLTISDYFTLSGGYYQITNVNDLKNFLGFSESNDNTDKFILTNDLDLTGSPGLYIPYLGVEEFNGNSKTISNLNINLPNNDNVGFFGYALGSNIHDLGIVNSSVTGGDDVGALVGYNVNTSVNNAYATVPVTGSGNNVGGLVGFNDNSSSIANSYATGSVSGSGDWVGGLVGYNIGSIDNSYTTGSVSGSGDVGGLVGNNTGSIANSYATGSVSGSGDWVGGLVGYNTNSGTIDNSYATGSISGGSYVGGLVGYNNSSSIANSYATGSVSGGNEVGGLVGYNFRSSIVNSYATGNVSGSNYVGGLVGSDSGSFF